MDSFSEQPRRIKCPQLLEQLYPGPVVPEVSMIGQNSESDKSFCGDSILLTYKAWKERNGSNIKTNAIQNIAHLSQTDFLKKQVRFESHMQSEPLNSIQADQNLIYEPLKTKSIEQIYLSSIPNQQLDLSVCSPKKCLKPNKENLENISPNINLSENNDFERNQLTCKGSSLELPKMIVDEESKKNSVIDLYNYKRDRLNYDEYKVREKLLSKPYMNDELNSYINRGNKRLECKQILSNCSSKDKHTQIFNQATDEPTVKDLLKIIQQQNEQLIILQKQVATLLKTTDLKQIESSEFEKYQTSTQLEKPISSLKRPMQQFSLDVMTSFEVSIRRQQNLNRPSKDNYYQSKITEITESTKTSEDTDGVKNKINPLFDPVSAIEAVQFGGSNDCNHHNIIDIDMKDYSSDDSSDDEVEDSTNAGWTFYNNIMGQVNEIFKKSGIRPFTISDKPSTTDISENVFKHNVMKKVKEATVKHLKSIGVHVPNMDISDEPMGPNGFDSNNVSFAVKQLLMKYLPDEQLAKISLLQEQPQKTQPPGLIKRRPEFSLATLQYMKKYNLLHDDNPNGHHMHRPNQPSQPSNFERILDITAIRQQPKLL